MSRLLNELGHETIVAHARNVRLIGESRKKADRPDSQTLARLVKNGFPAAIKEDVAFRRKWAERCGFGFESPSAVPTVPKTADKAKQKKGA